MKVIGFSGSPRLGGNTDKLVMSILEGASFAGAETSFYNLSQLEISPCISCFACRKIDNCALKDGMQNIYEEIQSSDAVVIGSPVYMWQMSGQTKMFFDRLMPFLNVDMTTRLKGKKKAVLAFTQGQPDVSIYSPYFNDTMGVLNFLGFEPREIVAAGGTVDKNDISKQLDLLEKAKGIGAKLVA